MTNVSRPKTNDKTYQKAYRQLVRIIADLKLPNSEAFVSGLLTESEQIMLVKRLASIFMFEQGYTPYAVALEAGTSISTAQRIHRRYVAGEYMTLTRGVTKKQKSQFIIFLRDFTLSAGSITARKRLLKRLG